MVQGPPSQVVSAVGCNLSDPFHGWGRRLSLPSVLSNTCRRTYPRLGSLFALPFANLPCAPSRGMQTDVTFSCAWDAMIHHSRIHRGRSLHLPDVQATRACL